MESTGEEGINIDDEVATGASKARVLVTPVPSHFTCLKHGKMVGKTSFPRCNEGGCYLQHALDNCY